MSTTTSLSPYDGTTVASVEDTPSAAVRAGVALAEHASAEVSGVAPSVRRAWLEAIAEALEAHRDELVDLADRETGLGTKRLTAEVSRTAGQLRFYGEVAVAGSYLGVTLDEATGTTPRLVRLNMPLGPVAVFGASNFPFAFSVLGNDTGSALAAGCPVVAKAHPAHVGLSMRLAALAEEALSRAGAPEGTFGVVSGFEAGACLVGDAGVKAVAFTGSQGGGLALWRLANERDQVIPVYAEMGTVNPVVVTAAAVEQRLEEIAHGVVGSFTLSAGQYCTKPGLVLVPQGHDAAAVIGAALADAAPTPRMLTRAIAGSVGDGLDALLAAGASLVRKARGPADGWAAPAVVLSAPISDLVEGSVLLEECFGAVLVVVEYEGHDDLRRALSCLQGSLAGTVVATDDDPDAGWLVETLSRTVGRVTVNDWPTGVAFTWAQQHGGPWPATSDPRATSVGAAALDRFVRPVTYQSTPDQWLPPAGRSGNPWRLPRRVDGHLQAADDGAP